MSNTRRTVYFPRQLGYCAQYNIPIHTNCVRASKLIRMESAIEWEMCIVRDFYSKFTRSLGGAAATAALHTGKRKKESEYQGNWFKMR